MTAASNNIIWSRFLDHWSKCCFHFSGSRMFNQFICLYISLELLVDGVCAAEWWLLPRPTHLDTTWDEATLCTPGALNPEQPLASALQPAHGVTSGHWKLTGVRKRKSGLLRKINIGRDKDWTIWEIKTKRQTQIQLTRCSLVDYNMQSTDGVKQWKQQNFRIGNIP